MRNKKNPRPDKVFKAKVDRWTAETKVREKQKSAIAGNFKKRIKGKIQDFHRDRGVRSSPTFTYEELAEHISDYKNCYLTGRSVDIKNPSTYHFDHIEPRSRGGSNDLDNLGIVTPEANYAKRDLPLEDFLELCVDVVTHWGFFDPEDMK